MEPKSEEGEKKPQPTATEEEKRQKEFKNNVVELVQTELDFSRQVGKMAKLLNEKLTQKPPLKLSNTDRTLLEEARKNYQAIADNPYPWFGSNFTPDNLQKMSYEEQQQLCHNLAEDLKNNPEQINKRFQAIQWITMHYEDLTNTINAKKSLLDIKADSYISIPNRDTKVSLSQYNLRLMSVKDELPKEELNPPVLIKMQRNTGEVSFHIYGCSDGKIKFTDLDNISQLNELDFNNQQMILVSSEANQEIYQEIASKKGHNTSMKNVGEDFVISQYLILPIQRIPRLQLFMENLIKYTPSKDEKQTQELTSLLTKWKGSAKYGNELVALSDNGNKKFGNLLKKLPPTKLPYVIPRLGKEGSERENLAKQLEKAKNDIKTYENEKQEATDLEDKKDFDMALKIKKETVGILEKK